MIKTTSALTLVASISAQSLKSLPSNPSADDVRNHLQSKMSMQKIFSGGSPSTQSAIEATAAVSGDWAMSSSAASCSASVQGNTGYRMGFCAEDNDGNSGSVYSKYSCTQDDTTGQVVLTRVQYTDSTCTTQASTQTSTYSSTCSSGTTYSCSNTNDYSSAQASYSNGGVFMSGYDTGVSCSSATEANLQAYYGLRGCVDGTLYGDDSIGFYWDVNCGGSPVFEFSYESIFSVQCVESDDDDYDDVDDDGPIYDNLYVSVAWSEDSDDDCFHVESKIDYKGVEYTYDELKAGKEPECTVPHSPFSKGVVISTSCDKTVRVTDTHLMATTKGFQLAYSLKAGDVLYGDYDKDMCTVTSVEKEKTTQQYFGLNCVHSEVLASGLRASTFGDFHTLPSWYMTYVGGLVGTDTASFLGEYIAEWYFKK